MTRAPLVAPGVPPELVAAWCASAAGWFGPARVPLPRAPEKHALALLDTPLGALVAKRVKAPGWRAALGRFQVGRAERAFELARALAAAELATPEALAVLALGRERVLVTRYVDAPQPWEYLRGAGAPAELVGALARALARLHASGFRHRDLKASNLLVQASSAGPVIVFTDLDGLRRRGLDHGRTRRRDLARLSMSFESAPARAAGVRAGAWPELVRLYLAAGLERTPPASEIERWLASTRRWRERAIRRHLARGEPVR